jgi:hypothetical protein
MDHNYDIFEILPDESLRWKARVNGTQDVPAVLADIGKKTPNECFAINIITMEILACVNVNPRHARSAGSAE